MRSAIYYPHTGLQSDRILKSALLLWDNIEFIVPFEGYGLRHEDRDIQEGLEIIGRERCPNFADKKRTHAVIEEFATRSLPDSFYYRGSALNSVYSYGMWHQKLLPETWDMLQEVSLVGRKDCSSHFKLQDSTGLALMSILADNCAGTTMARVTDRGIAYASLTNMLVDSSIKAPDEFDVVIPLTLHAIRTSDLSLRKLIDFRRREAKENGYSIRDLRHRYVDRLERQVKALSEITLASDRVELNRQFEQEMKDDLLHLKDQLRSAKSEVIFSKEMVVTAVAAAGAFYAATKGATIDIPGAVSVAGASVTLGGLFATRSKYATSRAATLQKHPMSYLYEIERMR